MISPLIRKVPSPMNLFVLIAVVGALYFTRDICIPFLLAALLSFVLSPLVSQLQKWRVPRVPAAFLVVGMLFVLLASSAWMIGGQVLSLAGKLPQYQANVHEKFKAFQTVPGGPFDRLKETIEHYTREVESIGTALPSQGSNAAAATEASTTSPQPVVAIVKTEPSLLASIEGILSRMLGPITTFGIVMILTLFMLIRREDVRDRAIRLMAGGELHVATQALDDAGSRVSRFLLVQLIVNASFGFCVAIGLLLIGVPYSVLWGLLAAVLRFVPYFGAPISAIAPIAMAFAAKPGWSPVALTLVLFVALELTIANLIEPWLYGSHAQISPLAIIGSAIFWSWLWGPVGLLLAMPLTVCLVVMGQHIPSLKFLGLILGDEPVLEPEARFYQRLLADDQAEAWEIAEEKLRGSSLLELYDTMIIPALILAEQDRQRELLDETREKYIFRSVRDLLEELGSRPMSDFVKKTDATAVSEIERAAIGVEPGDAPANPATAPSSAENMLKVLCVPANDEADELSALMLSHLLAHRSINAQVISFKTLAAERMEAIKEQESAVVCVSAVPPKALLHARYLCNRLRARHAGSRIVIGLWQAEEDPAAIVSKLPAGLAEGVVMSLADAVARIISLASTGTYTVGAAGNAKSLAAPMAGNGQDLSNRNSLVHAATAEAQIAS